MKRIVDGAPWPLRLGRWMIRSGIRGGYRLIATAAGRGQFDVIARYPLGDTVFHMPIYREDNRWDEQDLNTYEAPLVSTFCNAIGKSPEVILIDCGADVGVFSALVATRCSNVKRVIAFEPNSGVFEVLRMNLAGLRISATAFPKAVSSFTGKGTLVRPSYDSTDHGRYLVPGDGDIDVATIDSLGVFGEHVAIKIDVEGGEGEVLKGAERTIREAKSCAIALEAHPKVAERIGVDPYKHLSYLSSIRQFDFLIAETGQEPDGEQPLLSAGQEEIWNIIASTK